VAEVCVDAGWACLIEKPLAAGRKEAQRLVARIEEARSLVAVGHVERFNEGFQRLRQMRVKPRFLKSDRVARVPFRPMDTDVVLDVMIHDLDLCRDLADSPVLRLEAVATSDIANAHLRFRSGAVADLTASRMARKQKRRLRVFTFREYLSLDFDTAELLRITGKEYRRAVERVRRRVAAGLEDDGYESLNRELRVEVLVQGRASPGPLERELTHFVSCVRAGRAPDVDARVGLRAVQLAEYVRLSAASEGPVRVNL
jgi:predicted dehydrogenase